MRPLRMFVREPLFQFFLLGGLIYAAYLHFNLHFEDPDKHILISSQRIDQLSAGFASVWKRKPTEEELQTLIKSDIREEVYYRDALALSLDENDAVVRRRLRQKIEFASDVAASNYEPTADELNAYFVANNKTYQRPPQLTFEQVYLGNSPAPQKVAQTLDVIHASPKKVSTTLRKHTFLPAQLNNATQKAVDATFGTGFFTKIMKLPRGQWHGPVKSGYGLHLVKVLKRIPAQTPALNEIRDRVRKDWRVETTDLHRERDYADRRKRYSVEVDWPNKQYVERP